MMNAEQEAAAGEPPPLHLILHSAFIILHF
jgi:hypothetical protein